MIVHRICKAKYASAIFSGAGGMEVSGRWHHKGRPIVYTAQALSLCALEYLVHLRRRDSNIALVSAQLTISDEIPVRVLDIGTLPAHWNIWPPLETTMAIGDTWLVESKSAVLKVPSALIPGEYNFLLNPQHPDFAQISQSATMPARFTFDERLIP
jgi:RES domain-containing protein